MNATPAQSLVHYLPLFLPGSCFKHSIMTIADFLTTINSTNTNFKIKTKSGISMTKIANIEKQLNVKLPDDVVSFYSATNGLEGDDWIFNIIPLNEAEKLKDEVGYYLAFAEYMIYSETCGLEINESDSNNYKFFIWRKSADDFKTFRRKYVANSITDFIKLYCDKGTVGIFSD